MIWWTSGYVVIAVLWAVRWYRAKGKKSRGMKRAAVNGLLWPLFGVVYVSAWISVVREKVA